METILVEIKDNKAYRLLEDLQLIKVLKEPRQPRQKLSEKYAGKLPFEIVEELQNDVSQSRQEWNRNDI